ncbi:MAG: S8 family serine peptidase [Pyrinomonadaceae bacterium]|nr:S8 family serine peptidase [Pyrinomonadaceae bacterium]
MSEAISQQGFEETVRKQGLQFVDDRWKHATGKGIRIGIVDSGIERDHEGLRGKINECFEARRDGTAVLFEPSDSGDSAGHGTACAGIVSSIAPEAEINSIKVLGSEGIGGGHTFLAGLEFAIRQGYDVINLSLGTTKSQLAVPLHDLLDRGYRNGCVIVAAANNLPQPSYPSVFSSSLISVSKSENTDPFDFGFRFGDVIELAAPGVNVRTTWLNGSYRNLTGNSFACPQIVGLVALLLETYPDLTPFQVKTALYSIARHNQNDRSE